MTGLRFDFADNDIIIQSDGSFMPALIDNQNCALIALSQICRLTRPEVGSQLGAKLANRTTESVDTIIAEAIKAVQKDGGKNVSITLNEEEQIFFNATYDD